MMGKMAEEMQDDEPDSPLKVKLGKLADMISRFGYIGAVVIAIMYFGYFILSAGGFAAYFSSGAPVIIQDIVEAVSLAVVIIVCAVPEGLPLMISLVLMQNTSKMLDHNVLVRKAEGIETAGSLNILFSDKTGTITKGPPRGGGVLHRRRRGYPSGSTGPANQAQGPDRSGHRQEQPVHV